VIALKLTASTVALFALPTWLVSVAWAEVEFGLLRSLVKILASTRVWAIGDGVDVGGEEIEDIACISVISIPSVDN